MRRRRTVRPCIYVTFPEAAVPRELRLQVVVLQRQAWPDPEDATEGSAASGPPLSHDPALDPRSLLLVDGDRVRSYAASGLSTVVTASAERRRGHGRRLVVAARAAIARSGADLGLFTCDTPLAPFYVGAGWPILAGAAIVGGTPSVPLPSDRFDKVTLAVFFSERAKRHAGTFAGARIELYPGEIDRLW